MAVIPEQDVVVIGAGMAGMTAAITAADAGARVTVLEKAPDLMHSSTAFAGGAWGVKVQPFGPYTVDQIVRGVVESSHNLCDAALVRALYTRMAEDVRWLLEEVRLPMVDGPPGGPRFMTRGQGPAIPPHLQGQLEARGVPIHCHAAVRKLLTDDAGAVWGVRAETPDGPREFEAGAVVIATGGFEANGAMVLQYCGAELFNTAYQHVAGPLTHTGDGQLMAMEVGASFMRHPWMAHCEADDRSRRPGCRPNAVGGPIRALRGARLQGLWLNRQGRRFIDESKESDPISTAIARQPRGVAALVGDAGVRARFAEELARYEEAVPDGVLWAESVEELAVGIEAPAEEVRRTLEEYNRAVGEDGRALALEIPKGRERPCAVRLDTPPYWAVYPVYASLNTLWGGLEVSPRMEVLDRDGRPIPNLYTAGATFGGTFYGEWFQYPSGTWSYTGTYEYWGACLPTCLVTGRLAGEAAVSRQPVTAK
jgi:succinate dehydrogenase/fumarate reductase flavoprotein subunit